MSGATSAGGATRARLPGAPATTSLDLVANFFPGGAGPLLAAFAGRVGQLFAAFAGLFCQRRTLFRGGAGQFAAAVGADLQPMHDLFPKFSEVGVERAIGSWQRRGHALRE